MLCAVAGLAISATAAESDSEVIAGVDRLLRQSWEENGVVPSPRADDGEFARRVTLDVLGHIPPYDRLAAFLEDRAADKRQAYIDALLDDPKYVANWCTLWANLLVGRGNNNTRPDLERWLRNAFSRNLPYDRFVYELVAATGTPAENGATAFLSRHLNNEAVPATSITTRLFLGMQVQCTQCHNHPFNEWKQAQFWGVNSFFKGTQRQNNVLTDTPTAEVVFFERRNGLLEAANRQFVDGTVVPLRTDDAPRAQLAKLITDSSRPYLAQAAVNRMWGHFFGHGFTRPVDDMGPHNPPAHPELLEYLAVEFQRAGYDTKRLIRWIASSEAYNLTSRIGEGNTSDDPSAGHTPVFSRMYLKQFTAEQLYDSLLIATAADRANRNYEQSEQARRRWLEQFVQLFGTDENDETTTFNGNISQALVLMNGELMESATSGAEGSFLRRVLEAPGGKLELVNPNAKRRPTPAQILSAVPQKIETLFLITLARKPTGDEMQTFSRVYRQAGTANPIVGLQDVFWALLNSNEFIINH